VRNARQVIEPLKWELTDTLEFVGYPSHEELAKAGEFGRKFGELIKASAG
jgi:hypothetical protein